MLASYMWEEFYAKPLTMTLWWSTLIIHARYVTYSHIHGILTSPDGRYDIKEALPPGTVP